MKLVAIITTALSLGVSAVTNFTVSSITVNDSGNVNGDVVRNSASYLPGTGISSSTLNTDGDLNLRSFISGGVIYNVDNYVSGIGSDTLIDKTQIQAVIQPNTFTGVTPPPFYTGDQTNFASYLTSGERGLSFSTALNYKSKDNAAILDIPLSFKGNPFLTSRPTFIIGDGADNQSPDRWEFLSSTGTVLSSFVINSTYYDTFGDQGVDRVITNGNVDPNLGSGYVSSGGAGDSLGLGLGAFSLESSDFTGNWQDVALLRLYVPDNQTSPKTDYAFIGVDTDIVISPNLVIPEPSSASFLLLSATFLLGRRKRK